MPTLIPVTYALARCGHLPTRARERTNSATMAVPIASSVCVKLSRTPKLNWAPSRIAVMSSGGK